MKIKKRTALFFLFLGGIVMCNNRLYAQGTGGFFNQASSKVKLMLAQIAGYGTFLKELKSGYNTTQNGLNTAHEFKNGTYSLHTAYFNSLMKVNPVVASNPKGKAMIDLQKQINTLFQNELDWQQQQKALHSNEINYIQQVYTNLLSKCKADMDELTLVLTPGKLQMNDHQRIERIDGLYASMQDKYAFAGSFTSKCRQMAKSRLQAGQDRDQLKKLYGIN